MYKKCIYVYNYVNTIIQRLKKLSATSAANFQF